jgi:hypothetical protein
MTEASFPDRDGEATAPAPGARARHEKEPTSRFLLGLFVLAELLCFGVLIAWAVP